MNRRKDTLKSEEERNEISCDLTKSLDYNFHKNQKAKAAKEKADFKYQNFSEAVNFLKSFDNNNKTKKNLTTKINSENFKRENKIINQNNPSSKGLDMICENKQTEKNLSEKKPESNSKHFNTDGKSRKKQSFKDFDLRENLLSKLENFEISEYSKTNAHFSREDEHKFYMKFEKNIEIKNNNILTKSHGNKHFSMANGPYRMDIKPMLGKIKELQEYNFENNFNLKLNLNSNSNSNSNINNNNNNLNLNSFGNERRLGKRNFESVNFESLRNFNLEKIENLNLINVNNNDNNTFMKKSCETLDEIRNCMKVKPKYDTEKINVNDYYHSKNKNAEVPAKREAFENTKISEAELLTNLQQIENEAPNLLKSLSIEEKSNENLIVNSTSNNNINKDFEYEKNEIANEINYKNDKNCLLPKADFKSVSNNKIFFNSINENPNAMKNGGGAAFGCKTLKSKIDSGSNTNPNSQSKNAMYLNLKKSIIESKNSDSNISNGLTPISLNRNLHNDACSKEHSTEDIIKDKDVDINEIKKEDIDCFSNGKSSVSNQNVNENKNKTMKIPNYNANSENNLRNNKIISNVNFDSNNILNTKDDEFIYAKNPDIYENKNKITAKNNIFNNNVIKNNPKNLSNTIFPNSSKNIKNSTTQAETKNKNLHKRISSGLKVVSVEKQTINKTSTVKNESSIVEKNKINPNSKNLSLDQIPSSNLNESAKPNQSILNEENLNYNELLELVNGGGISNGNFKVFQNPLQANDLEPYPIAGENKKSENFNLNKLSTIIKQNISINSAIKTQENLEDLEQEGVSSSSILDVKINQIQDVSKSQALPLSMLKQKSLAINRKKLNINNVNISNNNNNLQTSHKKQLQNNLEPNEYSETKIMGDDILEDLDEIKDLDVNIKLTKSHKFPRRLLHQRKKSERKVTVSDIDLSSMRESYYNSRILNLNNSSTFNNANLEAISRKQFFKKFNQNKNKNLNSQKNILILDPNLTGDDVDPDQSINLLSRSISVISKKNISNFERLDKIRFNKRKNSKHLKSSFLSSFQNLNNISSQRIKKAFFASNNIDNLFFGESHHNNLEMNSFFTVLHNKSNLNHTNFLYSNNFNYSNNNAMNMRFNYNNNNYANANVHNVTANNSVFYENVNKSLSKIILKNNLNSGKKNKMIQDINDLVVFLDDNVNKDIKETSNNYIKTRPCKDFNLNLKDNIDNFEKELSGKNVAENLITDKNFDPLISTDRDNVFANGDFLVFNNSDKSNPKTSKKTNSKNNIIIFDNEETNFSKLDRNNKNMTNNKTKNNNNNNKDNENLRNNDNNFSSEKLVSKKENIKNLIIDKNEINNLNNKKNICTNNNEILEISNFLSYDYNLNPKHKEKNPENSEMEEHEVKLERLSQGSYNNVPSFKMFNNNNLSNLNNLSKPKIINKHSAISKASENNNSINSNGIRNYVNRSVSNQNLILHTEEENFTKEKDYLYKDTFTSAQNYLSSELNEFPNAINGDKNDYTNCKEGKLQANLTNKNSKHAYESERNYDNFDYCNIPGTFGEHRKTFNSNNPIRKGVNNNTNNRNNFIYKEPIKTDSKLIVDLECNLYVKSNFDNSQEDLEKKGKIRVEENFMHNKRFRPDCPSPYDSNSNIVISLNNTNYNNNLEEDRAEEEKEKSKSNIMCNSAMKKKMKPKNFNSQNKQNKNKNNIGSYESEGSSTNLNNIKNDSDEIIDLNSLDSASPQDFDTIKIQEYLKNNSGIFITERLRNSKTKNSRYEEKDDAQVNYSTKITNKINNEIHQNLKDINSRLKPQEEIEIQVEQEEEEEEYYAEKDKRNPVLKSSIETEGQEHLEIMKNKEAIRISENDFAYFTPEKANNLKDANNFVKIRNHNKISTNSILKNSKIALFYCKDKPMSDRYFKEEQIDQLRLFFENNQATMHNIYDLDFINNLLEKENKFRPDENYFGNHPNLTHEHRAILVDWIMEICEDLAFKRDTLHYAVNYLDRFLSKTENIEKNILQLIGVACLSIAGKFEEIYIPKCEEYISITENRFSKEQLIGLEKYIISTLDWGLNPTTLIMWLNWYLCQWDLFIESVPDMKEKLIYFKSVNKCVKSSNSSGDQPNKIIFFKKADEKSYIYYRQATQLIDAFLTDFNHVKFPTRHLIASVILIIICIYYEIPYFVSNASHSNFTFDENFYMELFYNMPEYEIIINQVFGEFLNQSFNIAFEDIIPALVYASRYIFFDFSFDLPLIIQLKNEQFENGNYEEFLSFQTHNKKNFDFVMEVNK